MKYHGLSAIVLAAAVILEVGGFAGVTVMLAGGVAGEMWFWIRGRGAKRLVPYR